MDYFFFPLEGSAFPFEFQDEPFLSAVPAFASAIFAASAPFFFLFMIFTSNDLQAVSGDGKILVKEH